MMKKWTEREPALEGSRVEFREDREVYVDGCVSVLEYEPETVKLNVGKYNIRIYGTGLHLTSLNDRSIRIDGRMQGLEFRS